MDRSGTFAADWIGQLSKTLAAGAANRLRERRPELVEEQGDRGFPDVVADTQVRLDFLCQALAAGRVQLLSDHLAWLKISYAEQGLSLDYPRLQIECLRDELTDSLPPPHDAVAGGMVGEALRAFDSAPSVSTSLLTDDAPHVGLARHYLLAVLEGRRRDAEKLVLDELDSGTSADELIEHVLMRSQHELGRMWQVGDVHPAEEHFASRLAERLLVLIHDRCDRHPPRGQRVIVASVGGNDHDLAARMLADRFDLDGWDPILLGANVPADAVARSVVDHDACLVTLSASLALHVRAAHEVCSAILRLPEKHRVPILIGGAPFAAIPDLYEVVGAHATTAQLLDAVEVARGLVPASR